MSGRIVAVLLCSCIVVASLILYSCASTKPPRSESATTQQEKITPTPIKPDESRSEAPPPASAEIHAVIERIYKGAVTLDESSGNAFAVGDFNGDESQDIAILVRPVKGKLSQLNDEYANWTTEEPRTAPQLAAHKNAESSQKKPAPVKIQPNDLLLTIVHGYQQSGWRNPAARQTYLLRNAAGKDIKVEPAKEVLRRNRNGEKLPGLRGDVILETLEGESGLLYWTGSRYSWQSAPFIED